MGPHPWGECAAEKGPEFCSESPYVQCLGAWDDGWCWRGSSSASEGRGVSFPASVDRRYSLSAWAGHGSPTCCAQATATCTTSCEEEAPSASSKGGRTGHPWCYRTCAVTVQAAACGSGGEATSSSADSYGYEAAASSAENDDWRGSTQEGKAPSASYAQNDLSSSCSSGRTWRGCYPCGWIKAYGCVRSAAGVGAQSPVQTFSLGRS